MSQKLTPWFPEHIKPVRPGVYEAHWSSNAALSEEWPWSFWTGRKWANSSDSPEGALANARWTKGAVQEKRWRGLAEPPK